MKEILLLVAFAALAFAAIEYFTPKTAPKLTKLRFKGMSGLAVPDCIFSAIDLPARLAQRYRSRGLIMAVNHRKLTEAANAAGGAKDELVGNWLSGPIAIDRGFGENPSMVICAANASRFLSSTFSVPLTAFSVGWKDPENLDELLEFIAPKVIVGRRGEFRRANNVEEFLFEVDDIRAIGTLFKRLTLTGDMVPFRTYNKGLTMRIDKDDERFDGDEEMVVGYLRRRMTRNDLIRAVTLLLAAAHNTPKTWDATSNPDRDFRKTMRLAGLASGIRPNRGLVGGDAWDIRADAYETPTGDAAANTARFMRAERTPEEVGQRLGLTGGLKIIDALYQSTLTAKARIVGALAVFYNAMSGMMKDEPSNIKRFITPTPEGEWRVFRKEDETGVEITSEHYSNNVITSTLGIEKLTISES